MARAERKKIEVSKSRTPLRDAPDLFSVAVLYVTDAEAKAIDELARMLQNARINGEDQFVVSMRKPPLRCPNGHPLPEGSIASENNVCRECQFIADNAARSRALLLLDGLWDYRGTGSGSRYQCRNGHPIQNADDDCYECRRGGLAPIVPITLKVGMVLDNVPYGWTLELSPTENRCYLLDQDRVSRAVVQKVPDRPSDCLLVIKLLGPTAEPEPEKVVGDAARFAGIDFQ